MLLKGKVVEASSLKEHEKIVLFDLMNQFYDHVALTDFLKDFAEKDYCILLRDETEAIRGFSTQKIISVDVEDKQFFGVFSGDTIIHKNHWGSLELYRVFARYFTQLARQYDVFYWFLISKGYKTYKILPLFFKAFYPRNRVTTPELEKKIMDNFGNERYPGEYDQQTGVIDYRGIKDKLKEGVADLTEKHLKDQHIAFFSQVNPGYVKGDDLVCIARLEKDNLNKTAIRLLLGDG